MTNSAIPSHSRGTEERWLSALTFRMAGRPIPAPYTCSAVNAYAGKSLERHPGRVTSLQDGAQPPKETGSLPFDGARQHSSSVPVDVGGRVRLHQRTSGVAEQAL